jgi:release factor glutamine methyltransferase
LAEKIIDLRQVLAQVSDSPGVDSQVLLAHILDKPRAWIISHPEIQLTSEQETQCNAAAERLKQGTPLPYVLGHWEFFGLDFEINPDVLIPRPETELLVENALEWLQKHPNRRLALDIGTGSGCIAIALASQIQDLFVIATDISLPALKMASHNAIRSGVSRRVECLQANLYPPIESHFDLICANLPYIPTKTLHSLPIYEKEPEVALNGGLDGLDLIRRMLKSAPGWISPGGLILLEIESSQGQSASTLAATIYPEADILILPDLAGLDRLLRIQTKET